MTALIQRVWDNSSTCGFVAQLQIKSKIKNEGYVKGMAWDPEGKYVAISQGDGMLLVYEADGPGFKPVFKKRALRRVRHCSR